MPRVSYELSSLGRELTGPLQALLDWIGLRAHDVVAAQETYDAAVVSATR
ncbi:hypothetical protein [Jiangella muralis]